MRIRSYFLDGSGHWQEAMKRMPYSLEAAKHVKTNPEFEFRIRRHNAILLRKAGKLDEAAQLNLDNINFASALGRQDWLGEEYEQLGRVRVRQRRFTEAEPLYLDALKIARSPEGGGRRYEGQALNCLGELYRRQGIFDKAIEYFEQVLELYKDLSDEQGVCATIGHLGNTYSDMLNYEKATQYYASAISIFERAGKAEVEGSLYQNLGLVLQRLGQNVDALACFIVSANICDHLGIEGWGGKSPAKLRDGLLVLVDTNADDFRVTSGNNFESVLSRARIRVQEVVNSILAST